jgi:hypothetical protein
MKKIRMILASAAVVLAVGGVFASTLVTTTYYRPSFANSDQTTGVFCNEAVTTLCNDLAGTRCVQSESYSTPMGTVVKSVIISKIVDNNPCAAVNRSIN